MKKIRNAVRVFCIKNGEVLCIKYINSKNKGYYDLPRGKIEENETIYDTAIREVKEETDIFIDDSSFKGALKFEYSNMLFIFNIIFASNFSGNLEFFGDEIENNNISYKLYCNNKHEVIIIKKGE